MAVLKNLAKGFYIKGRPSAYKASDAAYTTGGNRGWVIAALPSKYPRTSQQKKVAEVAAACGIKKGIGKSALQKAMTDCVGPKMRK